MGREARECYARESERVNPGVRHLGAAADPLDEGAVEGCVVRQHRRAAHKVRQVANRFLGTRCASNVYIAYPREALNLWGNGPARVNEGLKALDRLAARESRSRDLYELAVFEREACGLGIEHHDVLFEQVKPMGLCPFGKALVVGANVLGRSRKKQPLKGGCSSLRVLFSPANVG